MEIPAQFERFISPEPMSGCWLWTGAIKSNGYAVVAVKRKAHHAHREVFIATKGGIPAGLDLDHLCRVRSCVNPDHLEPVNRETNVRRGICGLVNAARQLSKTHCPQGHPYVGDNLYMNDKGGRECRACHRIRAQAKRNRLKNAISA